VNHVSATDRITTIKNVRIFDGERLLDEQAVTIAGEMILNAADVAAPPLREECGRLSVSHKCGAQPPRGSKHLGPT
jgi:hypothetical protein